jgi:hypothetical protein
MDFFLSPRFLFANRKHFFASLQYFVSKHLKLSKKHRFKYKQRLKGKLSPFSPFSCEKETYKFNDTVGNVRTEKNPGM